MRALCNLRTGTFHPLVAVETPDGLLYVTQCNSRVVTAEQYASGECWRAKRAHTWQVTEPSALFKLCGLCALSQHDAEYLSRMHHGTPANV